MQMDENSKNASWFLKGRNSQANADYYQELVSFYEADNSDALLKLRSFALYAPRQVVSDFLVRYELFRLIENVAGSILEFGVFNGQGLFSWAHLSSILEPNNITREIIGFDTFAGFEGITDRDGKEAPDVVHEGGFKVDAYERISKAIKIFDMNRFIGHVPKIRLVKGDVTKTLEHFLEQNQHIVPAVLYLDMDIYKPTSFVLERLLKRVPKGGVVVFDEFGHRSYPGETAALLASVDVGEIALKRFPFCSRIAYFVR